MSKTANSHRQLWDSKRFLDYMLRTDQRMRDHVQKATGFRPSETISSSIAWMASWLYLRWLEHEDAEREAVALFNGENYSPIIPQWLKWQDIRQIDPDRLGVFIDSIVTPYIRSLDDRPLAVHLKRMGKNFLFDSVYDEVFSGNFRDLLDSWDFSKSEDVRSASDFLDSLIFEGVKKAKSFEIITPQPIVDLMVELANPQPGESVYDPCFGCGGLLVQSARKIREASLSRGAGDWERFKSNSIYGIEWNETAYSIAATRIVLAGIPEPGLELANALSRPRNRSLFDIVLADPPWGHISDDIRNDLRFSFNIPAKDWSNLFVQHAMQSLKPGGRAVITLPEGILFSAGPDMQLRKWLLSDFKVEGVISLPQGSFSPYTGIKSNIIVFRKEQPAESVYFYQVQKLAGTSVKVDAKEEKALDIVKRFSERETGSNFWSTPIASLMKRNWELVARKTGDEQLNSWLNKICSTETNVQKLSLQQVAVVATGIKYDRKIATEKQTSDDDFSLIRISDIREGILGRPSLFINKTEASQINTNLCIRSNDILLSKTGTIGKLALVHSNSLPKNATATQSLVIIRHNELILPEYLHALLNSVSYQYWMTGHARGAAIQHLPTDSLRHLELPVPELQLQDRVVKELKKNKDADPLVVLADIVVERNTVEAADFVKLAKIAAHLPSAVTATDPIQRVKQATQTYLLLSELLINTDFLIYWGSYTEEAVKALRTIDKFPLGTAMYSVLKHALTNIEYFDMYIEHNRPMDDDADITTLVEKLNAFLVRELNGAIDELKGSVVFITSTDSDFFVDIGAPKPLRISIINAGALPVTELEIKVEPNLGKYHIDFLDEQPCGEVPLSILIPKQASPGKFDITLHWNAKHLDGSEATGAINLAVEVRSLRDLAHSADLGTSPYVAGNPIEADRSDMFIGREEVIDTIKRRLPTSHKANVILLEGNRRSGKTSILNHLSRPGELPGWIPVYCDFQQGSGHDEKAGLTTSEVFGLLSKSIFEAALSAGYLTWIPGQEMPSTRNELLLQAQFSILANNIFACENPFEQFEHYLKATLQIVAPMRLLLMLDEFEKIQEGIDSKITSPQVPANLRHVLQKYSGISAILSYTKLLRKLRNEYWSMLFGLGRKVPVGALSPENAKLLVTKPAEGKLVYADQVQNQIIELCGCQPFIIQKICDLIFDIAAQSGQRAITESIVEQAAASLSSDDEYFRTLWDKYVGSERRKYILALIERLSNEGEPINLKLIEIKLVEAGIFSRNLSEAISEDLSHLIDLDLIAMQENGYRYHMTVPLIMYWIRSHVDFEDQKRKARQESEAQLQ